MFTFGSLFSGIGGLDLGLERAGWRCRWQVEIDPFCRLVLAKHWADVTRYADVKDCGQHNLESVNLIAGGFPCQPVSLAGKRKGQEDLRWLWPEFSRIVGELRPRFVLVENVPGVRSRGMSDILRDLAQHGYDAEWASIPAAAFGAPHLRYRIFIVAYAVRERCDRRDSISKTTRKTRRVSVERNCVQTRDVAHADCKPLVWTTEPRQECYSWPSESGLDRVAYGISNRVDRIRALGNAVVPQVAEFVGRLLLQAASPSNQRIQPTEYGG